MPNHRNNSEFDDISETLDLSSDRPGPANTDSFGSEDATHSWDRDRDGNDSMTEDNRNRLSMQSVSIGGPEGSATTSSANGAVPKISTVVPDGTIQRKALVRMGGARGFQRQPGRRTEHLDLVEEEIVAKCTRVLEKANEIHRDTVASYRDDMARLKQQTTTGPPELSQVKAEIRDTALYCRNQLRQIAVIGGQLPYEMLEEELERVVKRYSYNAYPSSAEETKARPHRWTMPFRRFAHTAWGFVTILVVLESIVNGWFFSEQIVQRWRVGGKLFLSVWSIL